MKLCYESFKREIKLTSTAGELLKSDIDAVREDVKHLTKNGNYVPRKDQATIEDVRSGRSATPRQAWECSDESDFSIQEEDQSDDEDQSKDEGQCEADDLEGADAVDGEGQAGRGPTLDEARAYLLAGDD